RARPSSRPTPPSTSTTRTISSPSGRWSGASGDVLSGRQRVDRGLACRAGGNRRPGGRARAGALSRGDAGAQARPHPGHDGGSRGRGPDRGRADGALVGGGHRGGGGGGPEGGGDERLRERADRRHGRG